jgi:hypothetical protein
VLAGDVPEVTRLRTEPGLLTGPEPRTGPGLLIGAPTNGRAVSPPPFEAHPLPMNPGPMTIPPVEPVLLGEPMLPVEPLPVEYAPEPEPIGSEPPEEIDLDADTAERPPLRFEDDFEDDAAPEPAVEEFRPERIGPYHPAHLSEFEAATAPPNGGD